MQTLFAGCNEKTNNNGVITSWVNLSGSNAYHVVTSSGTSASAVLDGFTVTAGNSDIYGGGMYSDPTLVLDFTGSALQIMEDESWGIDNVRVR